MLFLVLTIWLNKLSSGDLTEVSGKEMEVDDEKLTTAISVAAIMTGIIILAALISIGDALDHVAQYKAAEAIGDAGAMAKHGVLVQWGIVRSIIIALI